MFSGDWSNFDAAKFPELPYFYPDLMYDYIDPALCYPQESSIDLQFFSKRREEESGFLYSGLEWQVGSSEPVVGQTNEANEGERVAIRGNSVQCAKQVGPLSIEERQVKIQRYLAKRQRRNFHKKVVYLCRKRVADTRLRVKGRFVAKQFTASVQDSEQDKSNVSPNQT